MRKTGALMVAFLAALVLGLVLAAVLPGGLRKTGHVYISDVGKGGAMSMIYSYGQEKGIFDRYGLNVTFLSFADAYTSMMAFSTGKVDVMTSSPVLAATSYSEDEKLRIGMAVGKATENMLIVQPGIEVASDLKGKRIGVMGRVSDSYYQTKWYLESQGLDMEKDAEVVEVKNPSALVTSFETGQLDAVVLWGIFAAEVMSSGGRCLITCSDALQEVIGHPAYLPLIIFREEFLAEEERTAKDFLKAVRQILTEIGENVEEASEIRARFSDEPLEKVRESMEMLTLVGDLTPEIKNDLLAFFNYTVQKGYLESAPGDDIFYDAWR